MIGKIERVGFSIEKMALKFENAFQVPALMFVPTLLLTVTK